ncbi:MAG: hypothetical protein AAEJ52_10775 [Myxococcota bacterium]
MRTSILFYVSGHGFGHATRIAALIEAVCARSDRTVAVRSEAPHWIFTSRAPQVSCSSAPIDVGVLQPNGLDVDLTASLDAHEAFGAGWEDAIEREARWISEAGAELVVADIPALAFEAAQRAGVRAVGVGNFGWDWILDAYTAAEPRWSPIVERHRAAYSTADHLYRLPLADDMSAFPYITDVPLLVNRSRLDVGECRRAAGIAANEQRRIVLVSFGGLGPSAVAANADTDLDGYLFVGIGPRPSGFGGEWLDVTSPVAIPHEQLICAADAVLGKPGFSTVAEILAHERRFLFMSRDHFREDEVLVRELSGQACAREMPRDDFASGRWRPHLDALFDQPAPAPAPPTDGADQIANALLQ